MVAIRQIRETDASAFLALCSALDEETQFMLMEPGERQTTVEEQRERIRGILSKDNHTILVAESSGKLVGYVAGLGGPYRRNRRTVHVVMGILQAFGGQGLGAKLLAELEKWAREHEMHRLELTVMAHNERAISLYRKMGFETEGTKRHSLSVNGAYVDEYYMAKLLLQVRPNTALEPTATAP
jgi:RimJ/RimL family protein N-acetyltransferase